MTEEPAPRLSKRPLMPWAILALVLAGGTIAVLAGAVSPVLVLDVISLWPLLVPIVILAVVVAIRRRAVGILPLYLASFLVLATGIHLSEWEALPSSATDTAAPHDPDLRSGSLEISTSTGTIRVGDGNAARAYEVRPIRRGGALGAPSVLEAVNGDAMQLIVIPRDDGSWFRFAGWRVGLDPAVTWDLRLDGPALDVDLRGLATGEASLVGSGVVIMGTQSGTLNLDGNFRVVAGPAVTARLIGPASVPADWVQTDQGYSSPGNPTAGWSITVAAGSTVVVSSDFDTPAG